MDDFVSLKGSNTLKTRDGSTRAEGVLQIKLSFAIDKWGRRKLVEKHLYTISSTKNKIVGLFVYSIHDCFHYITIVDILQNAPHNSLFFKLIMMSKSYNLLIRYYLLRFTFLLKLKTPVICRLAENVI